MNKKAKPITAPQLLAINQDHQDELQNIDDDELYEGLFVADSSLDDCIARFSRIESSVFARVLFRNSELIEVKLADVRFENCDFSNSNWPKSSMNRVEFINCRLTGMRMPESRLSNVVLQDCKCDLLQLTSSKLSSMRFEKCKFSEADFRQAEFDGVAFRECVMADAEFYESRFKSTDFRSSRIEGMKINPQGWRGATIDSQQLIELASELAQSWGLQIDDSAL